MKKIILTSILFIFILSTYSQSRQEYYVRVKPNKNIPPTAKTVNANGTLSLTFTNNNLQNFFNSKLIYEYSKPFARSNSNHLQRIYKITLIDDSYVDDLLNLEEVENVTLKNDGIPLYEPNDFHGYHEGASSSSPLNLVHAPKAWDLTHGNENILVGITDTRFPDHEELMNKIEQEFDNPNINDNRDHGVGVASIIAGDTNNGIGIASIGFNTKLVVSESMTPEQMWNIAKIQGVKVLNGSWLNRCDFDEDDAEIFREIWEDFGVVVVFAADNGQCFGPENYVYPASYPNTISVSSVGHYNTYGQKI